MTEMATNRWIYIVHVVDSILKIKSKCTIHCFRNPCLVFMRHTKINEFYTTSCTYTSSG